MSAFCYSDNGVYRKTMAGGLDHMEFVLDSADEVSALPTNTAEAEVGGEMIGPCAPGSIAIAPGVTMMLAPNGTWFEL